MKKKHINNIEDMSKEQLITKCYTYKNNLYIANEKIKSLTKELELARVVLSERRLTEKLRICMEETLSYMKEIERMKIKEREKMQGE
jgi:hypothetical protein